jgi:hypothetical protein
MAAVRKSAVSTTGNWFRRDSTLSLGKGRSRRLKSDTQKASTLAAQASPVPSPRQRSSPKNLSVSTRREAVKPTSTPDLGKQPITSAASKSQRMGFLNLPMMSDSGAAPIWLLRVYTLHRYSSVTTFLLVATTLVVYGLTVYSQELWSQGYRRLQNLQRQERQLTTTNAALTHKMAEDAEKPTAGLDSPTPATTIFLPPSDSPNVLPPSTTPNLATEKQTPPSLGY